VAVGEAHVNSGC